MNRMYHGPLGGYRPNPWRGFSWGSKHTTYIQNNFFGSPRPMGFGGGFYFGGLGGYRPVNYNCNCNSGFGSFGKWMLGIGIGSTFLGGILNAFGIGGGSSNNNYTTVIDDKSTTSSSTSSTRRETTRRSNTEISSTTIQDQLDRMQKELDDLQKELAKRNDDDDDNKSNDEIEQNNNRNVNQNRQIGSDSDNDSDIDNDIDMDADSDSDSSTTSDSGVNGTNRNRQNANTQNVDNDNDNDSDMDDELTLTAGARPITITSAAKANDYKVTKGDTWYHIAQGMYLGPNGNKLSNDEIKAIYTALRAQYVDGGHVENGKVLDKNNNPVNVSNMDLPVGNLKLPDSITINGKTYNYNSKGSVTKVNYTPGNVTKAGTYNARQTIDNKWIATINGQDFGTTKYNSKQEAIEAAEAFIEEELSSNENKAITE